MNKKINNKKKVIAKNKGKRNKTELKKRKEDYEESSIIVPDTSVLIDQYLSNNIALLNIKKIIIPEAALAELEAQANKRRESGFLGLEEIKKLRSLSINLGFEISFSGNRPGAFEIAYGRSGEIDELIRKVAEENNALLVTADIVQAKVAEAKGIKVSLIELEKEDKISIESFFDDNTMSVHLKEGVPILAKKGRPGNWSFETIREEPITHSEIINWAKEIVNVAHIRKDGFIEIERKGSTIVQIGPYRIVITKPPFSDAYEITAVRPVKHLSIEDYELSEKLKARLNEQAEGILIAGAPGHGKSTFAQALAEYYASKGKVVKTIEAPRDLVLSNNITQYAISHGSSEEIHDILLLSRPDYTFFDEMRNNSDFKLFADMRLAGVGMIGVIHGTKTIDAIQRFIGRIELGVIPHVVDTVIFIKDGQPSKVYSIELRVKVPSGMSDSDLARPVVEIYDFENNNLEFEIYTYGEQTVVIPVSKEKKSPLLKHAENSLKKYFKQYSKNPKVELLNNNKLVVTVDDKEKPLLIGSGGKRIQAIEKELGLSIDVKTKTEEKKNQENKKIIIEKSIPFKVKETKHSLSLDLGTNYANQKFAIFKDDSYLMSASTSKKGRIKLSKRGPLYKHIAIALDEGTLKIMPE